eukprot:CAMPEP_0181310928 /NCGR_PEP_ID=MMETSP1101-20121128/12857_1 /TAXON_ID=46948 /ORGANISM="Rhodomonas abbreviata, Strain Caron Lab Isolate" /LENGTH=86 /DNA_ID=CAMNT_0023417609 /DNA_START=78 /DNA_END=338 /DNA_ORIENTATION=-
MSLEDKAAEIFEKADKDGDGNLSIKELKPLLKKAGVKLGKKGKAKLLKMDEDGDKQLSLEEFTNVYKALKQKGGDDGDEDSGDDDF